MLPDLPASAIVALICAISVHGLGHLIAARLIGVRFCRIARTSTGFRLMTDGVGFPSYLSEFIVTLGGPLGNALGAAVIWLLALRFSRLNAFSAAFVPLSLYLGVLNLLPLRGFDGGGLLLCLLCGQHAPLPSLLPNTAERVLSVCSALVLFCLWLLSVYLLICYDSALSLYVFCVQLFRTSLPQKDTKCQGEHF